VKEADLSNHLQNAKEKAAAQTEAENKEKAAAETKDYALNEALNLLKGISIIKK
jgi:carboxyl-terminal processing protease